MGNISIDECTPIIVEFAPRPGMKQVGIFSTDVVEKSVQAIDIAMNTIYYMAKRVSSTVEEIDIKPESVGIEFGLKLDADIGAMIAKAGSEATLNVKLTWGKY